jgi:valyl-tRNA synthetase
VIQGVTEAFQAYRFNDAASVLYQFLWHEYCDWYLEIVKMRLLGPGDEAEKRTGRILLVRVLEQSLRLLHPIMPFVTEEIWQRLPHEGTSIMVAPWPAPAGGGFHWPDAVETMGVLMEITREVRNIRSNYNIPPGERLPLTLRTSTPSHDAVLQVCEEYLTTLARISRLTRGRQVPKPELAASALVRGIEVYVPLEGVVDLAAERDRLNRELAKVNEALERVNRKLTNTDFLEKAPAEVISRQRATQADLQDARGKLQEGLGRIQALLKR